MRSRLLSSVAAAAIATAGASAPALAQATKPYDWTGFYIGLNAGHAWGKSNAKTAVDCNVPALSPPSYICDNTGLGAVDAGAVNANGSGSIGANGFTGGIQFGYNWQIARFVYGFEADYGTFHLTNSRQQGALYPGIGTGNLGQSPFTVASSFSTDWLATIRGRAGITLSTDLMAYGTGGLARTHLKVTTGFTDQVGIPGASETGNASASKTGYAVGGGLEWARGAHWTIKAEFLYVNFGKVTATGIIKNDNLGASYAQGISTSTDLTASVARLGVNYKF